MKSKIVKNAVIQSFIFNTLLLIVFSFILLNYVYPKFLEIEDLKDRLVENNKTYENLLKKGIDYKKFNSLHTTIGKETLNGNIYLNNILKEFDEKLFNSEFQIESKAHFLKKCNIINDEKTCNNELKKYLANSKTYKSFLENKKIEINKKKLEFEKMGINKKIEKIVPYYTQDSSIDENSLTDFKFINYLENLLDKFNLKFNNQIGVGNLVLDDSFDKGNSKTKKNINNNLLDSKLYYFPLKLRLEGSKRSIIDFIHYIENVGKINYNNGVITVFKEDNNDLAFDNMKNYFSKSDFYNNLFFDIKHFSFSKYIDSSNEQMGNYYLNNNNVWGFIKDTQGGEKFVADFDLRFYVKGMPIYKMKAFIDDVHKKYSDLLKIGNIGVKYIAVNKTKLKNFHEIRAMRNFKKINAYLVGLKKNMSSMKKNLRKNGQMSTIYKQATDYDAIFKSINQTFIRDLKVLSKDLFEKNKKYLGLLK